MNLCDCTDMPRVGAVCICHSGSDAIAALTTIRRALEGTYTAEGIRVWMHARNRRLDDRSPMSLVMAGRAQEVIDEARYVGGGMVAT